MTRRLFWLAVGAWLGISGYRRTTRLARALAGAPRSRPGASPRGVAAFARDVREGMDLHAARQEVQRPDNGPRQATAGPTVDYTR